jgi:multidrug efflux pump subunit AcrA (membrane-fusion protein)
MRVEVDVPNARLDLVPGMYADATLTLDASNGTLVAPIEAVDRTADSARVLVVDGNGKGTGTVRERKVSLGLEANDRVEVTRGVNEGDLVVIGSRAQLKPGTTVMPKIAAKGGER